MKRFKVVAMVGCVALISAIAAQTATAADWNRKTVVTFAAPVAIPGVHLAGWGVLPAGKYVFKIVDSPSDRHIVQISNQDETIVYATILAIPNYRLKATDKTVIMFSERPAGEPEALRAWFYPGRNWGEEFVYPKAKAIALAKASNTPVLFTTVDIPLEVSTPMKLVDAPVATELKQAPIMAIKPSGEEVQLAQVITPPPAEETQVVTAPAARVQENTLPATASQVPLVFMIGLVSLGAALTIRSVAKRLK